VGARQRQQRAAGLQRPGPEVEAHQRRQGAVAVRPLALRHLVPGPQRLLEGQREGLVDQRLLAGEVLVEAAGVSPAAAMMSAMETPSTPCWRNRRLAVSTMCWRLSAACA
jgi:hypothetical protein